MRETMMPEKGRRKNLPNDLMTDPMSGNVFRRFSTFIHSALGIKMPDAKRTMLQARLQKRLRILGIRTFKEYCDYVFSPAGMEAELENMVDAVTTNKTEFFRELGHFEYLVQTVLPKMKNAWSGGRSIRVWSAGCATGEEPYTLAMVLGDFGERLRGFGYSILATDISRAVLKKAAGGIYEHERIEPVPLMMRKKYLLRSKEKKRGLVRVVPALRNTVRFRKLNLMDQNYMLKQTMDIIFFRNVMIYFDRPTQEGILLRLCHHLNVGGYLFIGHSETLTGMELPLTLETNTVYRRIES